MKNCRTIWNENDFADVHKVVPDLPRPRKRLTELMLKSVSEKQTMTDDSNIKYFKPVFFRSPNKFLVDGKKQLTGIELTCNKLVGESLEDQKCVPTDEKEILNCNLAFRSIGYKSVQADKDLILKHGYVINDKGIVEDSASNLATLYVAGWLGTGPVGVILHTMGNAFQVAKTIHENLNKIEHQNKGGFEEIKKIINSNSGNVVDWNGWEKIDEFEKEQGKILGKPREKICSVEKMLEIAKI